MRIEKSERGFEQLCYPIYPGVKDSTDDRIAFQSSAVGDYEDSFAKPGSSFLWIGHNHHLDREEVQDFINHLQAWLKTGSFVNNT